MRTVNEIKKIYIEKDLENSLIANNIRERASAEHKISYIDDPKELLSHFRQHGERESKENLLLYSNKGDFFSSCPGTDGMVCCQYFVLNLGQGCLYDCHYCYLQGHLNNSLLSIFGNFEDLFAKIAEHTKNKNIHFRIGTGEYADSLALEPLTGQSTALVNYFSHHPNATLELKTKSSNVEELLDLDHRNNTVVSWSLNPKAIIDLVEEGTASLPERLAAAKKVVEAGYKIGFHLDPLIYFDDWEKDYHSLIDEIFSYVEPKDICWISAGSFRYTPSLKSIIQSRWPEDELTRKGEMLQGTDGKYRYFQGTRQEMFLSIRKKIESIDPHLFLYLCMESKKMWQSTFGFVPDSGKNLDVLFKKRQNYLAGYRD